MQRRRLSVWSVYVNSNTVSCKNYFFQRVWGGAFVFKKWKFRGGGGTCRKFPPWWRYGCFLELHIMGIICYGVNIDEQNCRKKKQQILGHQRATHGQMDRTY